MDDLTSPSKIAYTVVSVLKTHADGDDVSEIVMSPGNKSIPSPGAALFGFDIKSTTEKKNRPLTKAGTISKVRLGVLGNCLYMMVLIRDNNNHYLSKYYIN